MKRLILFWLLIQLLLVGCSNQRRSSEIEKEIHKLSSGDINEINEVLFGYTDTLAGEDNIVGNIVSRSSIKILSVSDTEIELEVTAPNMKGSIVSLINNNPDNTNDELLKELLTYADNTKKVRHNIQLNYTNIDKQLKIDYFNEEFIDALTGGLLSDYMEFRSNLKQSYLEVE